MASLGDHYNSFIEDIIKRTLKGEFRSKAPVYKRLVQALEAGTGEIFERSLTTYRDRLQQQLDRETSEIKQAKAHPPAPSAWHLDGSLGEMASR
jgi:Arc/MetJ-type ribon-helix-helix transcriptional regulator